MSILPPVWINWLAHWTSNPEVVGSNPGADAKILSVNIEFRCPLPVPLSQTLRTPGRRSLVAKRTILAGSHIRPTGLGFNYKAITSTSLMSILLFHVKVNMMHRQTYINHWTFCPKTTTTSSIWRQKREWIFIKHSFHSVSEINHPCGCGRSMICLPTINLMHTQNVMLNGFRIAAPSNNWWMIR